MRLSSALACAAAAVTCATALLLASSSAVSAATKPSTYTVEYKVGRELIFVTYSDQQTQQANTSVPLTLNRATMAQVGPRALANAMKTYTIVPDDAISVVVLLPRAAPARHRATLRPYHPWTRVPWHHVRLDTGFGGAARAVARHHPRA